MQQMGNPRLTWLLGGEGITGTTGERLLCGTVRASLRDTEDQTSILLPGFGEDKVNSILLVDVICDGIVITLGFFSLWD